MQIITVASATPTTTDSNTLITDSILNATTSLSVSYTIKNTGSNSITYQVIGGNLPDLSDGTVIQNSTAVAASAVGSYSVQVAPFGFYGIKLVSTSAGNPSTASILGRGKG